MVDRVIHLQADSKALVNIPAGTSKSTSDWFTGDPIICKDIENEEVGRIRVWVVTDTAGTIEVTTNGGTSYKILNQGEDLVINSLFAFDVRMDVNSVFNIKFVSVTGNVECFIDEVNRE